MADSIQTPISADLLNFGSPAPAPATKAAEKASQVQSSTLVKQALFGSDMERRAVATGMRQGNEAFADPELQGLFDASAIDLAAKYGPNALDGRSAFAKSYREVGELKNAERTASEVAKDSAIDAGIMAANTLGGAAALIATGADAMIGTDIGPNISKSLADLTAYARENQSELMQDRRVQHAIERELDRNDSDLKYQEDLANADTDGAKNLASLKNFGRNFSDTIVNYADDPIMIGSLAPEAIGSLIPSTLAIKGLGKANALRMAMSQGMTREAAETFLKTQAGQKLVQSQAVRMAPVVMSVTEGGAAINQAQQEILSLSEADFKENAQYQALRNEGLTHEGAQIRLAKEAGRTAGAAALPGAFLAGKISAPFAANPLSTASKGAPHITTAGRNVASEAIEESLQEANSQIASNLGQRTVGQEVGLLDGVADASAQGALGGIAAAGTLQAPSATLGTGIDAAKALLEGAKYTYQARQQSVENQIDAQSPVGSDQQLQLSEEAAEAVTEPENAPTSVTASELQQTTQKAVFLDQEEAAAQAQIYPEIQAQLEANPEAPVQRHTVIQAAGNVLKSDDADTATKTFAAIDVLQAMDDLRVSQTDAVREQVQALDPEDSMVATHAQVTELVNAMESSEDVQNAKDTIANLTREDVAQIIPAEALSQPDMDPEVVKAYTNVLDIISTFNPAAASTDQYDFVLHQAFDPEADPTPQQTRIAAARKISGEFEAHDQVIESINESQDIAIAALSGDEQNSPKARKHKTGDIVGKPTGTARVSKEIRVSGNSSNGLPSLLEHNRSVVEAVSSGRVGDAQDALLNLKDFAQSQINKLAAINTSLAGGKGQRVPFQAHGPFKGFMNEEGVYANARSINSVAMSQEVHADAKAIAGLFNALIEAYGPTLGQLDPSLTEGPLSVPALHNTAEFPSPTTSETSNEPTADPEIERGTEETPETAPQIQEEIGTQAPDNSDPEVRDLDTNAVNDIADTPVEPSVEPVSAPRESEGDPEAQVDETVFAEEVEPSGNTWLERFEKDAVRNGDEKNHFLDLYRPSNEPSLFANEADPLDYLMSNLPENLTVEQADALSLLVQDVLPDLNENFEAAFQKVAKDKKWAEHFQNGRDVLGWVNALPTNFRRTDEDGNHEFDPHVMQAVFVAGLDWILRANSRGVAPLDDERVSRIFGGGRTDRVTAEMRKAASSGHLLNNALSDIADMTMDLLGVRPTNEGSITRTQGMFKALAANALEQMSAYELVDYATEAVETPQGTKTLGILTISESKPLADLFKTQPDVLSTVLLPEAEPERYIDRKPNSTFKNQHKNRLGHLKPKEREAAQRLENTPFYMNRPMVDFVTELGNSRVADLLGFQETEGREFNPSHLESIKGKNTSIWHGLDGFDGYRKSINALIDETGRSESEIPVYFPINVTKVGRMQQVGPVTPQGDKVMREMITATNATLDLTNPEHVRDFWLTVAQSADISVEKQSHNKSIDQVQELMSSPDGLRPALDILREWLASEEQNPGEGIPPAKADAFVQAVKDSQVDVSMKLLHALLAVAKYDHAHDQGQEALTNFKTSLALEADGKTDGPVNAIVHMTSGAFDQDQIARMAKGGLFFADQEISLNDYIARDPEDLYQAAANIFDGMLAESLSLAARSTEPFDQKAAPALMRIMGTFLDGMDVSFADDGEQMSFSIDRKVTKNPLTVFLYGSGIKGISQKVAGIMLGNLSAELTSLAQGLADGSLKSWQEHPVLGDKDLVSAMATVFGGKEATKAGEDLITMLKDPAGQKAELSKASYDNFVAIIQEHFGTALEASINEATGGLAEQMRLTQTAASVQAHIFKDAFDKEVASLQEQRVKEGVLEKGELLSEKDFELTFTEASRVAPIYETDAQSFHISAAARNRNTDKKVSESFSGRLSARADLMDASEPSVKVSPYLTIGTGDGRMILNIYRDADGDLDTSLAVFDGVELAADKIHTGSRQINNSVFDGWMEGSIYGPISEGFAQMLSYMDEKTLRNLSDQALKDIHRALGLKRGEAVSLGEIQGLGRTLESLAQQSTARKNAMRRMNSFTDHMASSADPHHNEGAVAGTGDALDFQAISDQLNEFYQEELTKLENQNAAADAKPAIERPSKEVLEFITTKGQELEGTSIKTLNGSVLLDLFTEENGATKEQVRVAQIVLKNPEFAKNTAFFFGDQAALTRFRDERMPDLRKAPIEAGQYHPGHNVAFVTNGSIETILHEMLHAETAQVLQAHYGDRDGSASHIKLAARNLEHLMKDFLRLVPDAFKEADGKALAAAQSSINALAGHPAAQVSEFLSWTLANQRLTALASQKPTRSKVTQILKKTLNELKRLLGISGTPGTTFLSNVRFNAEVLVSSPTQQGVTDSDTLPVLNQVFGENSRAEQIENRFMNMLGRYLEQGIKAHEAKETVEINRKIEQARQMSRDASEHVIAEGFGLDLREANAFQAVHSVMMSGMQLNSSSMRQLNRLYNHAIKALKPKHLQDDPESDDAGQIVLGKRRYDALTGASGLRRTAHGRSDQLATFMALGMVNDTFRSALGRMSAPKDVSIDWSSWDTALTGVANSILNLITSMSLGKRKPSINARQEMDTLAHVLSEIQGDNRFMATMHMLNPGRAIEPVDKALSRGMKVASEGAVDRIRKLSDKTTNPRAKNALAIAELVASIGSKDYSDRAAEAMTILLNKTPNMRLIRESLSDLRGMTVSNASLIRQINPVKAFVDGIRQDFRENVPEVLASAFSRKLTKEEWQAAHQGIGETDLLALGLDKGMELLADPSLVDQEILNEEEALLGFSRKYTPRYKAKAKALAEYMVHRRVVSNNLLRNAKSIAHLYGEDGPDPQNVSDDLVRTISRLTSLYALRKLPQTTTKVLQEMATNETDGMRQLLGYQSATRAAEILRAEEVAPDGVTLVNGWKGYVPATPLDGANVIVADDGQHNELIHKGYTRIGTYAGDSQEGYRGKRGYYQSATSVRNSFRQGVAQTVHSSFQGVDARTGLSRTGLTASAITGAKAKRIKSRFVKIQDSMAAGDHLLPVYDGNGKIKAYELPMDPEKLVGVRQDKHLGRMLGVWSGRILEERASDEFNTELVKILKDIHTEHEKKGRLDEFVNAADPEIDDPVVRDAWKTLGWKIKQDAAEIFGQEKFFPVRRDMLNDALGYRSSSLTDPWTGVSRWDEKTQKAFQDLATTFMGKNAFKYLNKAEGLVTDAVSYAKTTIIVRSVSVAVGNMMSNALHLMTWGISPLKAAKSKRDKFEEIAEYVKKKEEISKLHVHLTAIDKNSTKAAKLNAQIEAAQASIDSMSIKPLIDAGEFSTISESLTEDDVAIREGKLSEYIEKAANHLPGFTKTVGKNLLITKDTKLFRILNRSVQYGDFVAKAVLYDHLKEKNEMSEREILDVISEEFVNYNRVPGRSRDYLESVGLAWFFNYKIRIQKVMARMIRDRPLSALLWAGGVGPEFGIDTVVSGSLTGAILDDRIGYSTGWGMGLNAGTLNPWYQLAN